MKPVVFRRSERVITCLCGHQYLPEQQQPVKRWPRSAPSQVQEKNAKCGLDHEEPIITVHSAPAELHSKKRVAPLVRITVHQTAHEGQPHDN